MVSRLYAINRLYNDAVQHPAHVRGL